MSLSNHYNYNFMVCTWVKVPLTMRTVHIIRGNLRLWSFYSSYVASLSLTFFQFTIIGDDFKKIAMLFSPLCGFFFLQLWLRFRAFLSSSFPFVFLLLIHPADVQMTIDPVLIEFSPASFAIDPIICELIIIHFNINKV